MRKPFKSIDELYFRVGFLMVTFIISGQTDSRRHTTGRREQTLPTLTTLTQQRHGIISIYSTSDSYSSVATWTPGIELRGGSEPSNYYRLRCLVATCKALLSVMRLFPAITPFVDPY